MPLPGTAPSRQCFASPSSGVGLETDLAGAAGIQLASSELLDDPAEWVFFGRILEPPSGEDENVTDAAMRSRWESHVVIQGMYCAACALTVEDALRSVPGVEQAEVSAATQRARVVWQAADVRPSAWLSAVKKAGYGAVPANDASARAERLRERRRALWRWLVAGFCMMQVMMYAWPAYIAQPGDLTAEMEALLRWASWVITLPVVLFACGPFFSSAWRDVRHRRVSMDLPVALGMGITFVVSTLGTFDPQGLFGREVYFDSLTMFVFFLLSGRFLELRLRDRTVGALESVMNRLPDSVERRNAEGDFVRVGVRRIAVGDVLRVLPGEAFPADGPVLAGSTRVDEALLTGESHPRWRAVGDAVSAGSINMESAVQMRVARIGQQTRFADIVALMESAALQKPRLAQVADRVARPFLVLVLFAAFGAAAWWWPTDPQHAMMVAVAVLIVTCPCALSLATPVAMLSAAGALAREGVLVRNLQALEALAEVDTVVFDKTGTLTLDRMTLLRVDLPTTVAVAGSTERADENLDFPSFPNFGSERQALALAAAVARHSLHPASQALVAAASLNGWSATDAWRVSDVQELPGLGLSAQVFDANAVPREAARELRLGSAAYVDAAAEPSESAQVWMGWAPEEGPARQQRRRFAVRFELQEQPRADLRSSLLALRRAGIAVQVLSGDRSAPVARVAAQAGISDWRGDCSPADKLVALQWLQGRGHRVAMVGDGLNDGPGLAAANASFAFGSAVPLAQMRSDFVVLGGQLPLIAQSILLARKTMRVVRQNLWWAAGYNAVSVPLAVVGWMPAWLAGLGMAASSLLVVLNAARLARALPTLGPCAGAGAAGPSDTTLTQAESSVSA